MSREINQQDIKRKRRRLESYIELKYKVESNERELISLAEKKEEVTSIKGVSYSDLPKGGKPVLFEDYIDKLVDKEKILNNNIDRANRRRIQIETAINNLEDSELRMILRMRYLDDYSDSKIGGLLNYERTTIYKKCMKAIELIKF